MLRFDIILAVEAFFDEYCSAKSRLSSAVHSRFLGHAMFAIMITHVQVNIVRLEA